MTAKQHLKMAEAQIAYWKGQAALARKALAKKSTRRPRLAQASKQAKAAPTKRRKVERRLAKAPKR